MACEKKPVILKWDHFPGGPDAGDTSFETLLDTTCERLWEKQIEYSVRRIQEMDEALLNIEKELDEFTGSCTRGCKTRRRRTRGLKVHGQKVRGQ